VPLIVYWPSATTTGAECDTPVITMDLFATILEMTGLEGAAAAADGLSLVPLLRQSGELPRRDLFWHYPHYQHYQKEGTTPYGAIRRDDWKLIEFYDDTPVELYNLRDDVGEQRNLATAEPERVQDLRSALDEWRKAVGAQSPTPNPNYDPSKPEHVPPAVKKSAD
jgi:arylsulfatase A-like enzyme